MRPLTSLEFKDLYPKLYNRYISQKLFVSFTNAQPDSHYAYTAPYVTNEGAALERILVQCVVFTDATAKEIIEIGIPLDAGFVENLID